MASIRERKRADGSVAYTVLWREGGHRDATQSSQTFDDPDAAETFRRFLDANGQTFTLAVEAQQQAYAEGVSVAAAAAEYLAKLRGYVQLDHMSQTTYDHYESALRNHVVPTLGARRLSALTRTDIENWVLGLKAGGYEATSIVSYHSRLSAFLNWATQQEPPLRPDNPARGVKLPRPDKRKTRQKKIEHDDYENVVLPSIPERWRTSIEVIAWTGVRVNEALALKVGDFTPGKRNEKHPEKERLGRLNFERGWKKIKGGVWVVGPLKTEDSHRNLVIPWELNDQLVELCKGRDPDDWLIAHDDGSQVNYSWYEYHVWDKSTKAMTDPKREGGHLRVRPTLHWLRHSHGAWLREQGVDILDISRRLGHTNIKTTGDIYGHETSATERLTAAALSRARNGK
jgi:integrase